MSQEKEFFLNVLFKDLKSDDSDKSAKAMASLMKIADETVVDTLVKKFSDPSWKLRKKASEVLVKIGQRSLESVARGAWDQNEDNRYWSIKTLAGLDAVDKLAEVLGHRDKDTRYYAVTELGGMAGDKPLAALIRALGDESWSIRKHAADCLEAKGPEILPVLKKAFTLNLAPGGNEDICYWAIKIVARLLGKNAVESLSKALKSDNRNLRLYAVTALGDCEGTGAIAPLVAALEDESWIVRRQAAEIIERFEDTAIPYLKQAFRKGGADLKYWSVRILVKLLGRRAISEFSPIIKSGSEEMRYYALEALAEMDDESVIPVVTECLGDGSWIIRKLAADILSKFGSAIVPHVESLLDDEHEDSRYWAIKLLGRVGGEGTGKLLSRLAESDKRTKQFIITVLGEMKEERVIGALIDCLTDENWPIRNLSSNNLIKCGSRAIEPLIEAMASRNDDELHFWGRKVLEANKVFLKGAIGSMVAKGQKVRTLLTGMFPEFFEGEMVGILLTGDEQSFAKAKELVLADPARHLGEIRKLMSPATPDEALLRVIELASKIDSPEFLGGFLSLASTGSESSVLASLEYLASKTGPEILDCFLDLMDNPSDAVRGRAIEYLASSRDAISVDRLLTSLANETPRNQRLIMDSLGQVDDIGYLDMVLGFLEEHDSRVRGFGMTSLEALATAHPREVARSLGKLPSQFIEATVRTLTQSTRDGDASVDLAREAGRLLSRESAIAIFVLKGLDGVFMPGLEGPIGSLILTGGPASTLAINHYGDREEFSELPFLAAAAAQIPPSGEVHDWFKKAILRLPAEKLKALKDMAEPAARQAVEGIISEVIGLQNAAAARQEPAASPRDGREAEGQIQASSAAVASGPYGQGDRIQGLFLTEDATESHVQAVLKRISDIASSGDVQAWEILFAALPNNDSSVQVHIIEALGRTNSPEVIEPLEKFAEGASWVLKSKIFEVLGTFDPDLTADFLISALRDENAMVRKKVAKILGDMKSHIVIERVLTLYSEEGYQWHEDINTVFKLSGDIALRILAHHVSDKNIELRRRLGEFFAEEGPYVVQYLVETITEDNIFHRKECINILVRIGAQAIPFLERVRQGKPTHVRRWILQAMEALEKGRKM